MAYSCFCLQVSPAYQRSGNIPETEVGDGDLPEGDVMQIPVLRLRFVGFRVKINRLARLTATEGKTTSPKQEENTWLVVH